MVLAIAGVPAPAAGEELESWLAGLSAGVPRDREDVLAWRRRGDLVALALERAGDGGRPEAVRRGALIALGAIADSPQVAQRLEALADEAPATLAALARRAAARARGRAAVLARLAGPEEVQDAAELAPGTLGDVADLAADPLVAPEVRCAAGRALGRLGGIEEVGSLARLVLRGGDALVVREAALAALLVRGEHRQVGGLLAPLCARPGADAARLRGLACDGLEAAGELARAARQLLHARNVSPSVKATLAGALERRAVPGVAAALRRAQEDAGARATLAERCAFVTARLALGDAPAPGDAADLVAAAVAGEPALALAAAEALGRHRLSGLEAALAQPFSEVDPGERRLRAIHLIEALGVEGCVEPLAEAAIDGGVPLSVRQAAVHALGALGGGQAVAALLQVVTAPARGAAVALRREAFDALAACAHATDMSRAAARAGLADEEPTVRRAALRLLVAWGDSWSAEAVARLVKEVEPAGRAERAARLRACAALEVREPAAAAAALDLPDEELRDEPIATLALAYARALPAGAGVPALLRLLEHRSAALAQAARLELLRRYPPGRAFGALGPGGEARRTVARWREAWAAHPDRFE